MSKVDCGSGDTPCTCDCGHLSSSHVAYCRWRARCLVPGCICEWLDVCDCIGKMPTESDEQILAALGIAK